MLCAGWLAALKRPAACVSVVIHPQPSADTLASGQPKCGQPFPAVLWDLKDSSFPAKPLLGFQKEVETERKPHTLLTLIAASPPGDAPSREGVGRGRHVLPFVLKPRWGGERVILSSHATSSSDEAQ